MKEKILDILGKTLPTKAYFNVSKGKHFFGQTEYLAICMAVSDYNIHNVDGQKPQLVSLMLDLTTFELTTQVFCGNGGGCIYRKPNLELMEEKYLAMKSVKVPFRSPKKEEKFVLSAIEKFAKNWLETLRENKEVLCYQDIVDYTVFFDKCFI